MARLHSLVALLALFAFTWAQDAEAAPPVVSSASERVVTTSVASNFGTASLAVVTAFASEVAAVTASVSEAAGTQSASGVPVSPTAAASVPGTANFVAANASDLTELSNGNARFRASISNASPGLLAELAEQGQTPTSIVIGCADSRVSEGTIMDAAPGTLFTARQISNQYLATDSATRSVVAYGITELRVRHVILLGHIGFGGVAAAMIPPPPAPISAADALVQSWIEPVRELFAASTVPAIVAKREEITVAIARGQTIEEPEPGDEGFIALVKENVKKGVAALAADPIIENSWSEYRAALGLARRQRRDRRSCRADELCARAASEEGAAALPQEVIVHGLIYDIRDGTLSDLGISVGPEGPLNATVEQSAELVRRIKREHQVHAHRH